MTQRVNFFCHPMPCRMRQAHAEVWTLACTYAANAEVRLADHMFQDCFIKGDRAGAWLLVGAVATCISPDCHGDVVWVMVYTSVHRFSLSPSR